MDADVVEVIISIELCASLLELIILTSNKVYKAYKGQQNAYVSTWPLVYVNSLIMFGVYFAGQTPGEYSFHCGGGKYRGG